MCELAIYDTSRHDAAWLANEAIDIFNRMRSSLGLVMVSVVDEQFEYDVFRDVSPQGGDVYRFIDDHIDGSYRLIVHGRLATDGAVTERNAHPLKIDCDHCDIDYVLHNGRIHQWELLRKKHEGNGHTYTTDVDSEVIAHQFREVPNELITSDGHSNNILRQPSFILLNKDRIYISSTVVYDLTSDARMRIYKYDGDFLGDEENHSDVIINAS